MNSRRAFVKNGALALVGTAAVPRFLVRSVMAEQTTAQAQGKKLVVLFQRGAADGLNIVVPYREKNYYAMRPSIAIQPNEVLDLDGQFGLHPALAPLHPLFQQGHLAVVHAVGSPDVTRSHFDAQDYMESGTPGLKSTQDGWLNRALQAESIDPKVATAFRAVAMGNQVPRTLQGRLPAVAVSNLQDFSIGGRGSTTSAVSNAFQAMYAGTNDRVLSSEGQETFEAVRMLKANLGVEAAFADIGDWDTHQAQGGTQGRLANRLREFSEAIAAFWKDMGPNAEHVTLVTMSEFGRTARQNGTGGTDHGHGNVMFVLGGEIKGGKVYGRWPGLDEDELNEGRDLAVTTDFRQVLGEAAYRTLGTRDLSNVFPGASITPAQFLRFA